MFSFQNRQYIFRQADGELWNFFCDSRQCLCYNTLTVRGIWSNAVVLHKNVYQYFYAEMDRDGVYHILFQDMNGNIQYSRLDGQSIRTVPLLNSKSPAVYNKQLYIAPLEEHVYLFYVLQHENSFMLAYQALGNTRLGTPKVVDYVSGSNQPCSIVYDHQQNIYVFYQSYDGKYLQLGYKKFNTAQKHWSDFTPVTKYAGNCEYPHAFADSSGIIHLCYQRRAPKLFEMVYQQKAPDKNLWSRETVVHSSVHSFENASILQAQDKIVIYWVREDVIYYNSGSLDGTGWNRASRHTTQFGRQILCLCYKSNRPGGGAGIGDVSPRGDASPKGDVSQLSPGIYPGSLSNGLKLAFPTGDAGSRQGDVSLRGDSRGDVSQLYAESSAYGGTGGSGNYSENTLNRLQESVDEVKESWSQNKKEMYRITNTYSDLKKEMEKFSIRLNLLEKQFGQLKKLVGKQETAASPATDAVKSEAVKSDPVKSDPVKSVKATLDPEKLKLWEEWKEPEELRQVPPEPRPVYDELPEEDDDDD